MAAIRQKGSKPTITDRDRGYRKLMRRAGVTPSSSGKKGALGGLGKASLKGGGIFGQRRVVKVGIQGAEATETVEGDDITTVVLAAVHEFGRLDGTIPERSFIRATVDRNRAKYVALIKRLARLVLFGKLTDKKALAIIGERVASDIKAAFEQGLSPDLADSTKARKEREGKPPPYKPVLDTGHLKNSVTYVVT